MVFGTNLNIQNAKQSVGTYILEWIVVIGKKLMGDSHIEQFVK